MESERSSERPFIVEGKRRGSEMDLENADHLRGGREKERVADLQRETSGAFFVKRIRGGKNV